MFHSWKMAIGLLSVVVLTVGCQTQAPPATTASSPQTAAGNGHVDHQVEAADPKVSASLAKLNSDDRKLAEAQQFCAVMNHQKLGSMGTPLKFEIKGEPVFVCCAGCKAKALTNRDETLAKVAALKLASKTTSP